MTSAAVHPGARRRAVARWVLAVALALGVLGMHALVGPTAPADGSPTSTAGASMGMGMGMGMGMPAAAPSAVPADVAPSTGGPGPAGDPVPAGGHSMLMSCLAVLGAAAVLLLVATSAVRWPLEAPVRTWRRRTVRGLGRPPPWAVPSLHQLSLLRV